MSKNCPMYTQFLDVARAQRSAIRHRHRGNDRKASNLRTVAGTHRRRIGRVQKHCPLEVMIVPYPKQLGVAGSVHGSNLELRTSCNCL